jgi:lysophospholipase L1-like esterase
MTVVSRRTVALALSAVSAILVSSNVVFADAPPSLNLAAAFADTKATLAAGGQANIVVLGDSLSFRPGSYLPVFTSRLQQTYGNAGAGYQGFSLWTGTAFNNGWLRTGINADNAPHHSLDGLWSRHDGVTTHPNTAVVRPSGDHVRLQYLSQPGGGTFKIRHGDHGGVVTTIDTDGPASAVQTFDYRLEAGQTQYTIEPSADGPVTILGQNNINDNPGVRVHRGANGGWGVNNFLQRDSTFDQQLGLLNSDLVMVWIGQNDQAYERSSYASRINELVDRLQSSAPSAEIVLIGTYDQGTPKLAQLVEGMADVAQARGVGFINLHGTAGNAAFFNSRGFLDDGVHFSSAGGEYMGNFLYNAFVTDGASLVPEPATAGAVIGAMMLFARRRRG